MMLGERHGCLKGENKAVPFLTLLRPPNFLHQVAVDGNRNCDGLEKGITCEVSQGPLYYLPVYWTKLLRSTVSYGYTQINSPVGDPGTTYHISNHATANLIVQTDRQIPLRRRVYLRLAREEGWL